MYQKMKRILAMILVILILGLYLAVLVLSFCSSPRAGELLMVAIVATVVLPVLLYIYLWLWRVFGPSQEDQDP